MTPPTRHEEREDPRIVRAPMTTRDAARLGRGRACFALAALCLSLACAQVAAAQGSKKGGRGVAEPPAAEEEKTPNSSVVRGRAVYEETGRPVRRGRVQLVSDGEDGATHSGGAPSVLTGAQGEFEFAGVAAGRYLLAVVVPGALVPASFPLHAEFGSGSVDYAEARQHFQEIVVDGVSEVVASVRARRGAAVSGRVTFENGDPAVGASVTAAAKTDGQQQPSLWGAGRGRRLSETADDRGVYRFAGLPPGEYVVSVSESVAHGSADNDRAGVGPYGAGALLETFYPSTKRRAEAVAVAVAAGEERAGVDVTIIERALHQLSGTVVAQRGGAPVAGARVVVLAKDGPLAGPPNSYFENQPDTTTDEAGRFSLREIPDGDYVIHVSPVADLDVREVFAPAPRRKQRAGGETEGEDEYRQPLPRYAAKLHEVKVAGRDLEGVSIEMGGGGRIVGTIAVEGGKRLTGRAPVFALTLDAAGAPRDHKLAVAWRDQFAVSGVTTGKVYLHVYVSGGQEDYYVKSITTADGKDLTREFLQLDDGSEVKGVRVLIAEGAGRLEGRVVSAGRDKTPAGGAEVLLVAADATRWAHPNSRAYGSSDWDGGFEVSAPPGDYLVFLLPEKDTKRILTESDVRAHAADAKRVTLRAKQTTKVELTAPEDK